MLPQELFALLEGGGDAAFAVDQLGCIRYWSPKAEELLGFTQKQALSKSCDQVIAGKDDAGCDVCRHDCQVIRLAQKKGEVPNYDLHAATAWGKRKWLNISIIVAHMERGPSPLIVHLIRDIDERKQMESMAQEILVKVEQVTGKPARSIAGPPLDLTARELTILKLLSFGRDTNGIATELHISSTTVRNHVQHILAKLDCHSRLEAVLRAVRKGYV